VRELLPSVVIPCRPESQNVQTKRPKVHTLIGLCGRFGLDARRFLMSTRPVLDVFGRRGHLDAESLLEGKNPRFHEHSRQLFFSSPPEGFFRSSTRWRIWCRTLHAKQQLFENTALCGMMCSVEASAGNAGVTESRGFDVPEY
jgi:hypothetical protein